MGGAGGDGGGGGGGGGTDPAMLMSNQQNGAAAVVNPYTNCTTYQTPCDMNEWCVRACVVVDGCVGACCRVCVYGWMQLHLEVCAHEERL